MHDIIKWTKIIDYIARAVCLLLIFILLWFLIYYFNYACAVNQLQQTASIKNNLPVTVERSTVTVHLGNWIPDTHQ